MIITKESTYSQLQAFLAYTRDTNFDEASFNKFLDDAAESFPTSTEYFFNNREEVFFIVGSHGMPFETLEAFVKLDDGFVLLAIFVQLLKIAPTDFPYLRQSPAYGRFLDLVRPCLSISPLDEDMKRGHMRGQEYLK